MIKTFAQMKGSVICDYCMYLHIYDQIVYSKCKRSMFNNYIYQDKNGHWIRPSRCRKEDLAND